MDETNKGDADGPSDPGGEGNESPKPEEPDAVSQPIHHQPISARVPERVAHGAFSTGILISDSCNEFVLDFYQALTRPFQIVARVVVVPAVMDQIIRAGAENIQKYTQTYGPPPAQPRPPSPPQRPSLAEFYENFKLPDELLSGAYANTVIIGHSPAEFFVDFITGFYPTAAVSSRVIIAPPHMPKILETMNLALQQNRKRFGTRE